MNCLGTALLTTVSLAFGGLAQGFELVWHQLGGSSTLLGPSTQSSALGYDMEIGDDFHVYAAVDRVQVSGAAGTGASLQQFILRFYAVDAAGQPAALQQTYAFAAGDPNLIYDPLSLGSVEAILSTPFAANGRHFVTFQAVIDLPWYVVGANQGAVNMQSFWWRDNVGATGWVHHDLVAFGSMDQDLSFSLFGTTTGGPVLGTLSATSLPRSGRLKITGSGFGEAPGTVRIDGQIAPLTRWGPTSITCYVPEGAALGTVPVQVLSSNGASPIANLQVTARVPQDHLRWRFQMDSDYAIHRAAVASDGSIYIIDVAGFVYALTPDGGLRWVRATSGLGNEGPVAVASDGNLYVTSNPGGPTVDVIALDPLGNVRWTWSDTNTQGVIAGPAVGPDGNVYVVTDFGGSGLISLTPGGQVRWTNQGNPQILEYGQLGAEIVFGPGQLGGSGASQLYLAFDEDGLAPASMFAFTLAGSQRWSITTGGQASGQTQLAVAADGRVVMPSSTASPAVVVTRDPSDGHVLWTYVPSPLNGLTAPDCAPDGRTYVVNSLSFLLALRADGSLAWSAFDGTVLAAPIASPDGTRVFMTGMPNFGQPGFARVVDHDGAIVWQFPFGMEGLANLVGMGRSRFAPDGRSVYQCVIPSSQPPGDHTSWLYAFDLSEPAGTALCFGDGSGTACPCGNAGAAGNGCASSVNPGGANLSATGTASIAADTIVLLGAGMPDSSALYFQGTTLQAGGAGIVFGDGLRCVGGSVIRLGTKVNAGGSSQYPSGTDPAVSVRGLVTAPGVRTYQVWYRNAAAFCTPNTFNLTNGSQITWVP